MKRIIGYTLLVIGLVLTHLMVYSSGWEHGVDWYKKSKYIQKALESAYKLGQAAKCGDNEPYFLDPRVPGEH